MWTCHRCGRTFANQNQTHACAVLGDLVGHFAGTSPAVRAAFDAVLAVVDKLGPVSVLPERTRIALHVRMSFAAFVHVFKLTSPADVDEEFAAWLAEAYEVGTQQHLNG